MFACGVSTGEVLLWDVRTKEVMHELKVRTLILIVGRSPLGCLRPHAVLQLCVLGAPFLVNVLCLCPHPPAVRVLEENASKIGCSKNKRRSSVHILPSMCHLHVLWLLTVCGLFDAYLLKACLPVLFAAHHRCLR